MAMMLREGDLDQREKRGGYTISVVGCGRMGLPHACLLAEAGFKVIGVDVNPKIVKLVRAGETPFEEHKLEDLLKKVIGEKLFTATTNIKEAVSKSNIILFTVPTLIDEKGKPDYSYVEKACRDTGLNLRQKSLVIFSSTVGPGVTETIVKNTLEESSGLKAGKDFGLAYSPIRATPGRVLRDISTYPRVVGAINKESLEAASTVLGTIVKGGIIKVRDIKTAEATKLFENIYRDLSIALANDLAIFCEKAGIDFIEVQKAATTQPYCHLLLPGIVGGHIRKDPYLLLGEAEALGVRLRLPLIARKINDDMVNHVVRLVREALQACGKSLRRAKISILGVSYRPNIKESRGSRVRALMDKLERRGAEIVVYDPFFSYKELRSMGYPSERNLNKAVKDSDCILITVGHNQFRKLNLKRIKVLMRKPAAVVDCGHVVDPSRVEGEGLIYRGFGRGVWSI